MYPDTEVFEKNSMREEDYIFVTLDSDDAFSTDAVVVDVDNDDAFVVIDEDLTGQDIITLSDDTIMLSDADMLDMSSGDFDVDGADITILL